MYSSKMNVVSVSRRKPVQLKVYYRYSQSRRVLSGGNVPGIFVAHNPESGHCYELVLDDYKVCRNVSSRSRHFKKNTQELMLKKSTKREANCPHSVSSFCQQKWPRIHLLGV